MNEFYSDEQAPRLFNKLVDRARLDLPDWYLQRAEGAVIAGDGILRATGYCKGSHMPHGWVQSDLFQFKRRSEDSERTLMVRRCGNFWTVERLQFGDGRTIPLCDTYALVCAFSYRPIWTHARQAAMRLAEYCDPQPKQPVAGYWVDVRPAQHTPNGLRVPSPTVAP
jgi:hypothetical protein